MIQQCSNLFDILNVIYEQCSSFCVAFIPNGQKCNYLGFRGHGMGRQKNLLKKKSKTDQLQHQQSANVNEVTNEVKNFTLFRNKGILCQSFSQKISSRKSIVLGFTSSL